MEPNKNLETQNASVAILDEKYTDEFHQRLSEQRKSDKFCDAVLMSTSGDDVVRFPVHRNILAAASKFFHALFTTELNRPEQMEFPLKEIDAGILGQLIDFYYTGLLTLNDDNVQALLQWADRYIFIEMVDHCSMYLCSKVDPSNCIGFWNLAEAHKIDCLQNATKNCFASNFIVASECDEFLNAALGKVIDCLDLDYVNIKSEEDVFDVALRWINHDREQRKGHFSTLMDHVRLTQIAKSVIQDKIMPYSDAFGCSEKVRNILQRKLPRNCYPFEAAVTSRLVAFAGGSRNIEYFCPIINRWQYWHRTPFDDTDYEADVYENKLYMFFPTSRKIVEFDIISMQIIREKQLDISDEINVKSGRLVATADRIVIIFGDESASLCVQWFNKDDFSYINMQTIEEKLHDIRVEYFNHKMYIFGINAEFKMRGLLFVAEDLIGSQEIRDQTKCGVGHAVVCYDEDRLLSVGGNSILNTNQRSVQLIRDSGVPDSFSTQIEDRQCLDEGVHGTALAIHEGYVYAAGGKYESTGDVPSKRVQKYDLADDVWTDGPPMLNGRFNAKLITLSFPQDLV